jgi:hypothetical protein
VLSVVPTTLCPPLIKRPISGAAAGTFHCVNRLGQFHQQEFEKPQRSDLMLQNRLKPAQELLAGDAEINLTELSDAELLNLVKLDIHAIGI